MRDVVAHTGETIELRDPAARVVRDIAWISRGAIVVSFAHAAGTMALYTGGGWLDRAIAGAMTLIVDLILWRLADYLLQRQRLGLGAHWMAVVLFALAVITSITLNAAYLWAHRPPDATVPEWASAILAVVFSLLISGTIVVAGVIEGEHLVDEAHGARDVAELATLRDEAEQLRGELDTARRQLADVDRARVLLLPSAEAAPALQRERDALAAQVLELQAAARAEAAHGPRTIARLESDLESARAAGARSEAAAAQLQQETAQHRAEAEQERAASAQLRSEVAQVRAALDEARAAAGLDLQGIARAARDREVPAREIARVLGKSDSTVRAWIGKE